MSHPNHTNIKGRQGGSQTKIHNNRMKACGEALTKAQGNRDAKLGHLKNPAGRLGK